MTMPDTQYTLRPELVDLRWGDPAPELLPAARLAEAARLALGRDGAAALQYGAERGPGRLLAQIQDWMARDEGLEVAREQLFITGGNSGALDLLCTLLTRPGDSVLVESPTYHLALRILRDHGLEPVPVAADEEGLRPDALEKALISLNRGLRAPLLYLVPTFGNPTGRSLSPARRRALVELARERDFLVIEDDVYRELWYDAPALPSLFSLAPDGPVVKFSSFSKILAPGLRLGWFVAAPGISSACIRSGLLDSGGGLSHTAAHIAAAFMAEGWLDENVAALREAYRARRDVLCAALAEHLPPGCRWQTPAGGFFVWIELPVGLDAGELLPRAEAAGVSFIPGARFHTGGGGERHLRLSFSLLPPADLAEGARRLGNLLHSTLATR